MKQFEDHFSSNSAIYAKGRPTYPKELFEWLSDNAPDNKLAWDVATGNGQSAIALTDFFDKVIATDASLQQIENAQQHPKIEYKVESAETSSLPDNAVDLVTVAVGVHWFDFEKFYKEVKRVLKPEGIIAVWMYYFPFIDGRTEKIVQQMRLDILKDYWPERYIHILTKYEMLPFPFPRLESPKFTFTTKWQMQDLVNFFHSWSGTQKYIEIKNTDPVELVMDDLQEAWGDPQKVKEIKWDLYLKTGIVK